MTKSFLPIRNISRHIHFSALRLRPCVETLEDRCVPTGTFRSIDGQDNNQNHPNWGSANQPLIRIAPAAYADGISKPAGSDRPNAREISNALVAHSADDTPNERDLTAYIYIWGQFLDHDLDLTGTASPVEPFGVPVPAGDPVFDKGGTGTQVIPLNRSIYDQSPAANGKPRQQLNQVTAWLDGSQIYGSDAATATSLRTLDRGKLKTSDGNLPPVDAAGNYVAGDVRANENVELTSMHALFIREHNYWAGRIASESRGLGDEAIYQRARAMVIAELQVITYQEWLPALLGPNSLDRYGGYDSRVNPQIANEFSTAAFRLHTTINDDVEFFDNDGRPISFSYVNAAGQTVDVDGEVALFEAFNNPALLRQAGVNGILKYAASTHMEELDTQVVDSLRNFLFVQLAGGLDLASLNIQRGRDHGLADYNSVRRAVGLPRVTSFAQITSDRALQAQLKAIYGSVDKIDLWVGGLAEDHLPGTSTGPTIRAILAGQFERLRDGDAFWYQKAFSGRQLDELQRTTLADIIERNTDVRRLQDNVFVFKASVEGQVFFDRNGDRRQDRDETGLRGVRVELVNDEGATIAFTVTDSSGRYRFTEFHETGDYQVRVVLPPTLIVTTANPRSILISTGDDFERNVNFGVRAAPRAASVLDLAALGELPLDADQLGLEPTL